MTRTGAVMGTPYYMSPEQAKGAKGMDHRADLYAVGVILYECVTGRVPFNADTFNELLFKIVLETPQPIEQVIPDSDPEFNKVIQKAMAREPGLRYQSSKEFKLAVEAWAAGTGVASVGAMNVTPLPGMKTPGPMIGIGTPPEGSRPLGTSTGGTHRTQTGTPGTWAGSPPYVEGGDGKQGNVKLIASVAAGVLLLGVGGFAALHMKHAEPEPLTSAVAAAPSGPTPDEIRAAAQEDAKKIAAMAQQEADEKIKKAEDDARQAEERAKSQDDSKSEDEAKAARERVRALKAAVAAAKSAPAAKPAATPSPAAPPQAPAQAPTSGRHIRTEL
jgi:serine/threonine-protein kinase